MIEVIETDRPHVLDHVAAAGLGRATPHVSSR